MIGHQSQEQANETVVTPCQTDIETEQMDEEINTNEVGAGSREASDSVGSFGGQEPDYDSAFIATPESTSEPVSLDAIDLSHESSVAGSEPGTPCDVEKTSTNGDVDDGSGMKKKSWWRFWKGREGDTARKGQNPKAELQLVSTTGLLMESRPGNLPMKSAEEEKRHRAQYEQIIQQAKKKEERELQKQVKQRHEKCKREDELLNTVIIWKTEILPMWDTMCSNKAVLEMWWQGLPPSVRGEVWKRAIGNSLQITEDLYEIFLSRAREKLRIRKLNKQHSAEIDANLRGKDHEKSVEMVYLDVARTFPQLCIFQEGGPMFQPLHNVLEAYACYRPDIGYVQGMSFLAAVLLLNMDVSDAFLCLANLISRPCHLAFFRVDEEKVNKCVEANGQAQTDRQTDKGNCPCFCRFLRTSSYLMSSSTNICPSSVHTSSLLTSHQACFSYTGFVPFTADLCHWMWLVACGMSTSVMVMNSSSEQL
jgi:hypothetical protein